MFNFNNVLLTLIIAGLSQPALATNKLSEVPLAEAEMQGLTKEYNELDKFTVIRHYSPQNLVTGTASCTPGRTMRIWWSSIYVCRTYKDPGAFEEWHSVLDAGTASKHVSWSQDYNPPENLSYPTTDRYACWTYYVNKKTYFNDISSSIPYVYFYHDGYERDGWPNGNDEIPAYSIIGTYDNCVGNFEWRTKCGWTDDYRRYSCTSVQYYTY